MKKKKKGFSVAETVIVIAVIAVLVAVAIPTASIIGRRSRLSADAQAVYDMNIVLASMIADGSAPESPSELVAALIKNGFADFRPKTKFHTFYWLRSEEKIVLANEDDVPVYPEEYSGEVYSLENWFDLEESAGMPPAPTAPANLEAPKGPEVYTVTVRRSGTSSKIDFGIPSSAVEGQPYRAEILIPAELRKTHYLVKVTATMTDGDTEHKFVIRSSGSKETFDMIFAHNEPAVLDIPCVTGDITVHVSIKEYRTVTITGDDNLTQKKLTVLCQKGMRLTPIVLERLLLKEGYQIASATATMNGRDLGNIYDKKNHTLISEYITVTNDIHIKITTEVKHWNVKLVIKNNGGEVAADEKTVYYPDNTCTFDLKAILGTDKFEVFHQYIYPTNLPNYEKPAIKYDPEGDTVTVTNPKCDITIYYFVEYTE